MAFDLSNKSLQLLSPKSFIIEKKNGFFSFENDIPYPMDYGLHIIQNWHMHYALCDEKWTKETEKKGEDNKDEYTAAVCFNNTHITLTMHSKQ